MNLKALKRFFTFSDMSAVERRKLLWMTISFMLVIASYTLVKELKDSMFVSIVGKEYLPWAKQLAMIIFVPLIFFY